MDEEKDVEFEAENNEPHGHGDAEHKIAKLKQEIEKIKKERQEYLDGWQRSKADYVNLLKRSEAMAIANALKGRMDAVEELLPAFDAIERSKEHGELPEGFAGIARQLESAFQRMGLESVGAVGEHFDPMYHDALGQDSAATPAEDDTITQVLEKGWKVGEVVIRPAKVRVAHYKAEA